MLYLGRDVGGFEAREHVGQGSGEKGVKEFEGGKNSMKLKSATSILSD